MGMPMSSFALACIVTLAAVWTCVLILALMSMKWLCRETPPPHMWCDSEGERKS